MQAGCTLPSVANDRSVRALCASSTMTIGRRSRSIFTSDGFGVDGMNGEKPCDGESDTRGEHQLERNEIDEQACRDVIEQAEHVIRRW